MHLFLGPIFILLSLRWGNWKKWKEFYSTIQFFILGDLLYNFLLARYPMWEFSPFKYERFILPNHTLLNLFSMLTLYPSSVVLYLSNYPAQRSKMTKIIYILFFSFIYIFIEFIDFKVFKIISYYHSWNFSWSILFDISMFSLLILHYKKPGIALLISLVIVISLFFIFNVPIRNMR